MLLKKVGRKTLEPYRYRTPPKQEEHRGTGPSQIGRPSKEISRMQLIVEDEEETLAHSIPNRSKKKFPHNLSAAVVENRAGEKKH